MVTYNYQNGVRKYERMWGGEIMHIRNYINGKAVRGEGKNITVYNPANGTVIAEFPGVTADQAKEALEAASHAFKSWSVLPMQDRERYILRYADILESHREEIIQRLIEETGKTYTNAESDYQMLSDCLCYFIREMKSMQGQLLPDYEDKHISMIIRKPLGVVVGYLAWNFPLLNAGYKLGPALAAGCTLKPSSLTPLTTLYLGELSIEAGMPAGVINILAGDSQSVGKTLNESSIPQMITLIGSSETGKKVIRQSATSIKHYSLELGGNAPVIVMKDADVCDAARKVADGKISNGGQVCVAPNRIFVHKEIIRKFTDEIQGYLNAVKFGSGKENGNIIVPPLASQGAVENMEALVADAVGKGAEIKAGGKRKELPGYYFEPTLLTGVTSEMRVYKEEIFGPIIPIIEFTDEDNLQEMANDTEYGLAAYIYTNSLSDALNLSRKIDAGSVNVNEPCYQFNLPHGGCKQSGIGKDCSVFSLEEYFYIQRISIAL